MVSHKTERKMLLGFKRFRSLCVAFAFFMFRVSCTTFPILFYFPINPSPILIKSTIPLFNTQWHERSLSLLRIVTPFLLFCNWYGALKHISEGYIIPSLFHFISLCKPILFILKQSNIQSIFLKPRYRSSESWSSY